jgi:hypothetical protein
MAALMDMRMRVLDTLVAMGVEVEVTLGPAEQESKRQEDDDQTDGHLRSSDEAFRQVLAEQDHRESEGQQCRSMTKAPREPECPRTPGAVPLTRKDQGGDGRQVVGIGSVPKTQQDSHRQRHEAVSTKAYDPRVQSKHDSQPPGAGIG